MNVQQVVETARALRSVSGENPEYDGALVELSADLLGYGTDEAREGVREQILGDR